MAKTAEKQPQPKKRKPRVTVGSYLTDGKRLVRVEGIEGEHVLVEDARATLEDDDPDLRWSLKFDEIVKDGWRTVETSKA